MKRSKKAPVAAPSDNPKDILQIPRFGVEDELRKQPELFYDWLEKKANAIYRVDTLKDMVEEMEADLDSSIREKPAKFGLEKVTEKAVENTIICQPQLKALKDRLNKAKKRLNLISAVVGGLEHKKDSLGKLANIDISALGPDPETYRRQRAKILKEEESREDFFAGSNKRKTD